MRIDISSLSSHAQFPVNAPAAICSSVTDHTRDRLESLRPKGENHLLPSSPPKSRFQISTFVKMTAAIAIPLTILIFTAKALGLISGSAATVSILGAAASSAAVVGTAYAIASLIAAAVSVAIVLMAIWFIIQFTKNK